MSLEAAVRQLQKSEPALKEATFARRDGFTPGVHAGGSSPVPGEVIALGEFDPASSGSVAELERVSVQGSAFRVRQPTVLPVQVYFEPAPGAQSFHETVRPGFGQRREQVNLSPVALQEHFGDASRCPKIRIDLKTPAIE